MSIRVDMAIVLSSLLLLASCAAIDLETDYEFDPALYAQVIDQTSDNYPEIDPLSLDDEIKQWLHENIEVEGRGEEYLVSTLQDLLYSEDHLNIQYSDAKTHTAIEVFRAREGNCLSVMNLYVAMARYVGLDASFQTVEVQPSWDPPWRPARREPAHQRNRTAERQAVLRSRFHAGNRLAVDD